jgi:hypothetical protein
MAERSLITSINMAAIPVKGAGGLGMLGMVLLMAAAIPAVRWLLISSIIAGAIAAVLVIRREREHGLSAPPPGGLPMTLGLRKAVGGDRRAPGGDLRQLLPWFATTA